MRTCSKATKAKLSKIPRVFPSEWVRVAYYDAVNDKPMSAERERRMMAALGIAKPPRRFYRPCLSVELGEAIREYDIDVEAELWTIVRDNRFRKWVAP